MIIPIAASIENTRAKDVIKGEIFGNARNRTYQTHLQANLIRPTKVTINKRDPKIKEPSEKGPYKIMR